MTFTRRQFGTLGLSLIGASWVSSTEAATPASLTLTGQVVDKNNKGIPNVLVTAYRAGQKLAQTTTAPNGNYSLKVDHVTTITTVQYQLSGYVDGVVNDLCGEC